MAKIIITVITSYLYKYVMYFYILFCFVEAIIDQHGRNDLVACFAIFPVTEHDYTALQNGDFLQRMWAKRSRLSLRQTTPQIGNWFIRAKEPPHFKSPP